MSRKSGNTGHRLSRTSAASGKITARKKKAQKPGKIEVRFVCPICGGPHSKSDHGVRAVSEPTGIAKPKRQRRPRRARKRPQADYRVARRHAELNAAFESRIEDPAA